MVSQFTKAFQLGRCTPYGTFWECCLPVIDVAASTLHEASEEHTTCCLTFNFLSHVIFLKETSFILEHWSPSLKLSHKNFISFMPFLYLWFFIWLEDCQNIFVCQKSSMISSSEYIEVGQQLSVDTGISIDIREEKRIFSFLPRVY
jgi:hypothetical protein